LKVLWLPWKNLMIGSHNSSGKYEHTAAAAAIFLLGAAML
jgi:hypothetical protein